MGKQNGTPAADGAGRAPAAPKAAPKAAHSPAAPAPRAHREKSKRFSVGRLAPLVILLAGLVAFFAFGLHDYLEFDMLRQHRADLVAWVARNGALAALGFVVGYAAMVAFSLPGGAVATIFGGFLFGALFCSALVIVGATAGATALFLAARAGLGEPLRQRAGPGLKRMEAGFRENALSYLLVLRLVPLFPFWLVNLVPAFLGVPLRTYVLGTFIGIIPGTFVYASVGDGLGAIIERGGTPDLGIVFEARILIPLLGLAVLALIPVAYKWIRARGAGRSG